MALGSASAPGATQPLGPRDAWTPARFFILDRYPDICGPSQWYLSRFYLNARFVHAPAWDFERPLL